MTRTIHSWHIPAPTCIFLLEALSFMLQTSKIELNKKYLIIHMYIFHHLTLFSISISYRTFPGFHHNQGEQGCFLQNQTCKENFKFFLHEKHKRVIFPKGTKAGEFRNHHN